MAALLAALVPAGRASAQVLDSKGKEFWVAFMANWGSALGGETSDLRIYLSCARATNVTITYTATGNSAVIPVPVANQTVEVNVNLLFGDFVELDDVFGSNEITQKSLHITCDDEISLYGANIRIKSADAFLGLPVDVLTGRYIVLAYPNGYTGSSGPQGGHYDMPSEFAVVATEDGTTLQITPSPGLTINQRPSLAYQVSLNRGDVYFGQADLTDVEQDVSGTQLSANKPVAVFGGNKRTSIPTRVGNYRDHLCEQLPPLDAWGKGALLTPHFKVTPESGDTAVARILAAFPGTDVTVTRATGPQTFALGPGASIEIALTEPMAVSSTQPIMVAQYEHSVSVTTSGFDIGDPFMMLIPPAEQFDTAYTFQSIIHPEFVNQHYINIVIPAAASGSFMLDGSALTGESFMPIPGSRYVYAQVKVAAGSHYIRADSAFGLYAYGFGSATSYGYPGGMLFRKLVSDFEPPEISWEQWCHELRGFAYDSHITDTGVDSCYATKDTQNVIVTVDPFTPGADTVAYSARLADPYQDGLVSMVAIDSGGRSRTFTASIPGFTLRVANKTDAPALLDTFVVLNTKKFCRSIPIRNYGKFKQKITKAQILENMPEASIDAAQFPLEILPGGLGTIDVCFANLADTVVSVTLDISGDCGDRNVALIPIDNRVDTTAPSFGIDGAPCSDDFVLSYFDGARSAGIASVTFDSTENCTVENLIDPSRLPAQLVQVKVHRIDPRKEIVFVVTLRDAAGNSLIERDTIGGFTLNVLGRAGDTIGVRYDRDQTGDSLTLNAKGCDSVRLTNYGTRPLVVQRVVMRGNRLYSIPPAQFPIVLGPKESRRVVVCVEGSGESAMSDTMVVVDGCGHEEMVLLKNAIGPAVDTGRDRCGNLISINTYAPAKRVFLTAPMPNPAGGHALIDVALTQDDEVNIDIYSAGGQPVMSVVRATVLPAGLSRLTFDVSSLENGAYFCRMTTASGHAVVTKMVVQR